jgi:hypothetical protein
MVLLTGPFSHVAKLRLSLRRRAWTILWVIRMRSNCGMDRKNKGPFGAAPPERPAARRSAAWTGRAGGGRGAPQGCPGVQASGRAGVASFWGEPEERKRVKSRWRH